MNFKYGGNLRSIGWSLSLILLKEIFIKHNFKDLKKSVFVEKVLLDIFDNDEITLDEIRGFLDF